MARRGLRAVDKSQSVDAGAAAAGDPAAAVAAVTAGDALRVAERRTDRAALGAGIDRAGRAARAAIGASKAAAAIAAEQGEAAGDSAAAGADRFEVVGKRRCLAAVPAARAGADAITAIATGGATVKRDCIEGGDDRASRADPTKAARAAIARGRAVKCRTAARPANGSEVGGQRIRRAVNEAAKLRVSIAAFAGIGVDCIAAGAAGRAFIEDRVAVRVGRHVVEDPGVAAVRACRRFGTRTAGAAG